jgi:hypothetical protein
VKKLCGVQNRWGVYSKMKKKGQLTYPQLGLLGPNLGISNLDISRSIRVQGCVYHSMSRSRPTQSRHILNRPAPRGVGPCALKQLGAAFPQSAKTYRAIVSDSKTNRMSLPRQVVSRGDTQNIRNFQRLPSRPMQQSGCRIFSMDAYHVLMNAITSMPL